MQELIKYWDGVRRECWSPNSGSPNIWLMKELQEVLVSMRKIFFICFGFFFFVASIETDLCVATGVNDILNNTGKKVRKKNKSNNKNYFHYSLSLLVLFAKWYFLLDFLIM